MVSINSWSLSASLTSPVFPNTISTQSAWRNVGRPWVMVYDPNQSLYVKTKWINVDNIEWLYTTSWSIVK